jgi:hypothetical protein
MYLCTIQNMQPKKCTQFETSGSCNNLQCNLQHVRHITTPKLSLSSAPPQKGFTLVPATEAEIEYVTRTWKIQNINKTPAKPVKVEVVKSPFLVYQFEKRRQELEAALGYDAQPLVGFHGTAGMDLIVIKYTV